MMLQFEIKIEMDHHVNSFIDDVFWLVGATVCLTVGFITLCNLTGKTEFNISYNSSTDVIKCNFQYI